jgi:hypothetical protein
MLLSHSLQEGYNHVESALLFVLTPDKVFLFRRRDQRALVSSHLTRFFQIFLSGSKERVCLSHRTRIFQIFLSGPKYHINCIDLGVISQAVDPKYHINKRQLWA